MEKIAEHLKIGQQQRIVCCKQGSSTATVSKQDMGVSGYCFRCKKKIWLPRKNPLTYQELNQIYNITKQESLVKLPDDFTTDFTEKEDIVWLAKYGITNDLRQKYNIGYSPKLKRVILPIYNGDGELKFIQARSNNPKLKPKYINTQKVVKPCFISKRKSYLNKVLIITEDILSAIKAGECYRALSVLGTSLNDAAKIHSLKYDIIIIWLDPDEAGLMGAREMYQELSLFKDNVFVVECPFEPKELSFDEIKTIVEREINR